MRPVGAALPSFAAVRCSAPPPPTPARALAALGPGGAGLS